MTPRNDPNTTTTTASIETTALRATAGNETGPTDAPAEPIKLDSPGWLSPTSTLVPPGPSLYPAPRYNGGRPPPFLAFARAATTTEYRDAHAGYPARRRAAANNGPLVPVLAAAAERGLADLTPEPLSRYFPADTPQLGIPAPDIPDVLERIQASFSRLGMEAMYQDSPAGALLRAPGVVRLQLMLFRGVGSGRLHLSLQRRSGDHLMASRYIHKILAAASGAYVAENEDEPSLVHARQIQELERFLAGSLPAPLPAPLAGDDTSNGSEHHAARDQDGTPGDPNNNLQATLGRIFNALSRREPPHSHTASTNTDQHGHNAPQRRPFAIPGRVSEARRDPGDVLIADYHGSSPPRQESVFLVADYGMTAYREARFRPEELTSFGRVVHCERLRRAPHSPFGEPAPLDTLDRGIAILEVACDALNFPSVVAFMAGRMLECTERLQGDRYMYFVCNVHSHLDLASVALPPPKLRAQLLPDHRQQRSYARLKTWFLDLALSVDSAAQAVAQVGLCLANMDPTGGSNPRYEPPENHPAGPPVWSLGVLLLEAWTGLESPVATFSSTGLAYPFWVSRLGHFDVDIPDEIVEIVESAGGSFDSLGVVRNFFEMLRAVNALPGGARDLLRGMLQVSPDRRLTMEQVLRHPWLHED